MKLKSGKWLLISIILVCCSTLLGGCGQSKLNCADLITVEFSGANGHARAEVKMDYSMVEAMALGDNPSEQRMLETYGFLATLEYTVAPRENLSNGDKITIEITYNKDMAKKLGLNLTNTSLKFTVKDLEEAEILDPFADIELDYEGVSPFAKVIIRNVSEHPLIKTLSFEANSSNNLKMDDVITLTVVYNEASALAQGIVLEPKSKEYVVENLDQYLPDIDLLDSDIWESVQQEAMDLLESTLAKPDKVRQLLYYATQDTNYLIYGSSLNIETSAPELQNIYFESLKPGDTQPFGYSYNALNLFYRIDVTSTQGGLELWVNVVFRDIIQRADGSIDIVYSEKTMANYAANWDDLYRDAITADKSHYTSVELQ